MLTGDEVRRARQRAGWSQGKLAKLLNVAQRTVGNWERGETSPSQKEAVLRSVLSDYLDGAQEDIVPLRQASDAELVAEIARRFDRGRDRREGDGQSTAMGRELAREERMKGALESLHGEADELRERRERATDRDVQAALEDERTAALDQPPGEIPGEDR